MDEYSPRLKFVLRVVSSCCVEMFCHREMLIPGLLCAMGGVVVVWLKILPASSREHIDKLVFFIQFMIDTMFVYPSLVDRRQFTILWLPDTGSV